MQELKKRAWALSPLATFLIIYITVSVVTKDFYKMPVSVAFLIAATHTLLMNKKNTFSVKLNAFAKGMGQTDIMIMCLIFILAGGFASVAKTMGALDSTINLGISLLPPSVIVGGIFTIGCFISISIGTSVGTIAAITPMGVGLAQSIGISPALALGAVVGGAMFGDNLSMISDTTIAATRTQECEMRDKFRANIWIVLPPAFITLIIYFIMGKQSATTEIQSTSYELVKIIPYIFVLISALAGLNVIYVLTGGTLIAAAIGLATHSLDIWEVISSVANGIANMSELVIICLIVGGIVELIKVNGGISFIIEQIEKRIHNKKGAELGIGLLTTFVDACTANNTIAIIITGPIAKQISRKYDIKPARTASILDTFSCFGQGLIPYGAQVLTAVKLSGITISPVAIIAYLFYPLLLGISATLFILLSKK